MGIFYNSKIVTDGLVLCLDAANTKSYPGSGTTWYDLSGNGNNGTLTNGPTYNSTNSGTIVFDGSNDYVNCGNNSSFNNASITEIAVFRFTSALGAQPYQFISKNYGTGTDESFGIWWYGKDFAGLPANSWHATVYQDHTTGFAESPIVNKWYHMAHTFDNDTKVNNLYMDGVLKSTKTLTGKVISYDTKPLTIGAELENNVMSFFHPGNISNVQIYNRALSTAEIQQNFSALRGRYGI